MRLLVWIDKYRPVSTSRLAWFLFQYGLFFLPSSVFLAGLFLLPAFLFGSLKRQDSYWRDFWNYPFFCASVLMLIGCFTAYSGWLAWAGLANWLPFFWIFWAAQPYLQTSAARRRSAQWLMAGTVPVLVTGLGQIFLGWSGPWQLLNGLVIWFVDPGGQPNGRLSGLFDYANITGAWLTLAWPFFLATLLQPFLDRSHRIVAFILALTLCVALVLTDSRNAWGGLILAIPFVLGPASWIWLVPLLILMMTPIAFAVLPGVDVELQQWARKLVPDSIWARLSDIKYLDRPLSSTRLGQWKEALNLVSSRPFFGWGAAAFSVLYPLRKGIWHGHAHNLPLEIAVSHGLPVSLLIVFGILGLLIVVFRRVMLALNQKRSSIENAVFERAWWTASFVMVVLHGSDLPFFDSRLNIAGWILLAGLRCMISSVNLDQQGDSKIVFDVQ